MAEWQLPKLYMAVRFRSPAKIRKMFFNNFFLSIVISALLTVLTGCATLKYVPPTGVPKGQGLGLSGIYHRVVKGQTIWRISKIYAVELDEIIRINNIKDSTQIQAGQSIFIPGNLRAPASPAATHPLWRFEDFVWPKKGKIISDFGEKSNNGINKGITIGPDTGSNVVASASGTVVFSNENLGDYGKTLIISHNDGIMTLYSLLSHILVRPGDYINRGTPIAKCENGLLHFEIRRKHLPQNPYYYLPR